MAVLDLGAKAIAEGLDTIVGRASSVAAVLAGVGLVAVYTVNFVKDVLSLRRSWQRWRLEAWIARQISIIEAGVLMRQLDIADRTTATALVEELVELATAGDQNAFFDQPVEKLAGLANAGLGIALDDAGKHALLVVAFAHRADPNDLTAVVRPPQSRGEEQERRIAVARNRVASTIQRSLDGIVVALSSQWERLMRKIAVAASTGIILLAAGLSGAIGSTGDFILWVVGGVVGGLVAPAINDFSKSLATFGRR